MHAPGVKSIIHTPVIVPTDRKRLPCRSNVEGNSGQTQPGTHAPRQQWSVYEGLGRPSRSPLLSLLCRGIFAACASVNSVVVDAAFA